MFKFRESNWDLKDFEYYKERDDRIMYKFERVADGRIDKYARFFEKPGFVFRDIRYMWE
jgi:hypothetical protein